jgi:hypothetical protein
MPGEQETPKLVGLLVDVVFSPLPWSGRRKQNPVAMPGEVFNQGA